MLNTSTIKCINLVLHELIRIDDVCYLWDITFPNSKDGSISVVVPDALLLLKNHQQWWIAMVDHDEHHTYNVDIVIDAY